MTDVVDRVLAALNGRDIDAFAACYTDDATIEDGYDEIVAAGRSGIRERYAVIFETFPKVRVTPLSRTDVGEFVVQEERVTGRGPEDDRHVAVYLVRDGLIARERLLRA